MSISTCFRYRIKYGFRKMIHHPIYLLAILAELFCGIGFVWFSPTFGFTSVITSVVATILMMIGTIFIFGYPIATYRISDALRKAGFDNHQQEIPILLSVERNQKNHRIKEYTFFAVGLPYSYWENNKEELEAALNIDIIEIGQDEGIN